MRASAVRRVSWSFASLLLGATLLLVRGPARAAGDEPATQPATRPTTKPSNPEVDAQARKLVEGALAKYRAARSYQDKVEGHVEIVATDKDGQDAGQEEKYAAALRFARPNRLALVTDHFAIHCDGKQLWLYSAMLNQYTENDAPERLDYGALVDEVLADDPPHPVMYILDRGDKQLDELFPMILEFTAVTRVEHDGHPGQRVSGTFDGAQTPLDVPGAIPFHLWFDDKTGLLGEIRIDMAEALRKALGLTGAQQAGEEDAEAEPGRPKKIDRAEARLRLTDVRLSVDIPAAEFVYQPDKEAKKVKEFDVDEMMRMPDPEDLLGHPAPVFSGSGLDDKPLALEGLRGKVVVLDFWATWCGPCVASLPNMQKLSEGFTSKPVAFIGINQDAKGMEKKVRKFLEDKKVTFRQFLDPAGKLGRDYKIGAIPCTILIDTKGVVQAVHVGFDSKDPGQLTKRLTEQVEKLIKGENVFDPNESKKDHDEHAPQPAEPAGK